MVILTLSGTAITLKGSDDFAGASLFINEFALNFEEEKSSSPSSIQLFTK